MCSEPVTFGGGITMQNAGRSGLTAAASACISPRLSQDSYSRSSTSPGMYCGGSSVRCCVRSALTTTESSAAQRGLRAAYAGPG